MFRRRKGAFLACGGLLARFFTSKKRHRPTLYAEWRILPFRLDTRPGKLYVVLVKGEANKFHLLSQVFKHSAQMRHYVYPKKRHRMPNLRFSQLQLY